MKTARLQYVQSDVIESFKTAKKNNEITEDDMKGIEKDVQNLTDKFVKKIDDICAAKEKEIMEI